jgi:hypothetical protein
MGSEISSFIVEPIIGIGVVALLIYAIIEENNGKTTAARWITIAALVLTILLIGLNIFLTASAG